MRARHFRGQKLLIGGSVEREEAEGGAEKKGRSPMEREFSCLAQRAKEGLKQPRDRLSILERGLSCIVVTAVRKREKSTEWTVSFILHHHE